MATKNCTGCGEPRKYLRPETGYRCKECRELGAPEPMICAHCESEYTGHKRTYCTEHCRRQADNDRKRRRYKPKHRSRLSDMYLAWRNAQRPDKRIGSSGYQGTLEEYCEWRQYVERGITRATDWAAWQPRAECKPRERMSDEDRRKYWRRYQRMRRARDLDKTAARRAIQRGVESGRIDKPDCCEICGSSVDIELLHGHHFSGYTGRSKYRVIWVCVPCHVEAEGAWGGALARQ